MKLVFILVCFGINKIEIFLGKKFCITKTFADSFSQNQKYAELVFGKPTTITKSSNQTYDCGFDSYLWKIGRVEVLHRAFERFGAEEHFWITILN